MKFGRWMEDNNMLINKAKSGYMHIMGEERMEIEGHPKVK